MGESFSCALSAQRSEQASVGSRKMQGKRPGMRQGCAPATHCFCNVKCKRRGVFRSPAPLEKQAFWKATFFWQPSGVLAYEPLSCARSSCEPLSCERQAYGPWSYERSYALQACEPQSSERSSCARLSCERLPYALRAYGPLFSERWSYARLSCEP